MSKLLIMALATSALALTACDRNNTNTTDRTGTRADQTSGAVGLDANTSTSSSGTASTGTATTDTTTATNSGTVTTATNPATTTEAGSTTAATTDTSKTMDHKKSHAKKRMDKKTESAKANTNGSGAYIPPAEKPVVRDSTINEEPQDVSSSTVSSSEDESLNQPTYSSSATESSTTQAENSSLKDSRAMRDALQMNYYEPQSLQPDNTGITSITGEDRSHAQFFNYKGNPDLVDPTVNVTADFDKRNIDQQK